MKGQGHASLRDEGILVAHCFEFRHALILVFFLPRYLEVQSIRLMVNSSRIASRRPKYRGIRKSKQDYRDKYLGVQSRNFWSIEWSEKSQK